MSKLIRELAKQNKRLGIGLPELEVIGRRTKYIYLFLSLIFMICTLSGYTTASFFMQTFLPEAPAMIQQALPIIWAGIIFTYFWPFPAVACFVLIRQFLNECRPFNLGSSFDDHNRMQDKDRIEEICYWVNLIELIKMKEVLRGSIS